ncbi:MAG: Hsp70 family protein [bacterium]
MKEPMCGIDLGTTNSCIAYLKDGKSVPIEIEDGLAIVPSVVSLDEATGHIFVGKQAKNRLMAFPGATVRSIKRQMGKEIKVSIGAKSFSPEEISSFILKYLVDKASAKLGQDIKKVVITVPAYFNDAQRRATISAGELAGLEVLRIINEPTAASLVYDYVSFIEKVESPYIMVYDLGGGTFDVSILEIKGEIKEVLASCGDTALGGDDFDERLVAYFLAQIRRKTGLELSDTNLPWHIRLKEIAEKTKIALSDSPYVTVQEVAVAIVNGEPVNLDIEVSRKEYEEMISDLVDKTIVKVNEAISEAHLSIDAIGEVLLVGGATRTPLIQERLSEIFKRPIYHSVDPDLCVGLGAAVQNGLIAGEDVGHILLDVTAHSLGVKTADDFCETTGEANYFSTIIRRNTKIPVRKSDVYFTMVDEQEVVRVEVYQGESQSCKENSRVGKFIFELKPAPADSPVITEFAYDKEGLVHITVEQKGYNNKKTVTLNVRSKEIVDRQGKEEKQEILNYILQKARRLMKDEKLPANLRKEIELLGNDYEDALRSGGDKMIDDLEDNLLNKIEKAEERLTEDNE